MNTKKRTNLFSTSANAAKFLNTEASQGNGLVTSSRICAHCGSVFFLFCSGKKKEKRRRKTISPKKTQM